MCQTGKWLPSKVQTFRNLVLTNNLQGEILLFTKLLFVHTVNTEIYNFFIPPDDGRWLL